MALNVPCIENDTVMITVQGDDEACWTYRVKISGSLYKMMGPVFQVDGMPLLPRFARIEAEALPTTLANGSKEYRYICHYAERDNMFLEIIFRLANTNPVVRFAYILSVVHDKQQMRLTKVHEQDELCYLTCSLASLTSVQEVQCAEFVEQVHSYRLTERQLDEQFFSEQLPVMGPLLYACNEQEALLIAYEHGSQVPDAFLHYVPTLERDVTLQAVKGNYLHNQVIDSKHPYRTIWFQLAVVTGDEQTLAHSYREFVLKYQSVYNESRKPYIFYNTWAMQERDKWWYGRYYLDSIYEDRILAEIDAAARIGVEVFVIDTGWYIETGDWQINLARFPAGLKAVKTRLDGYGMKLGLWFGPTSAALSSHILQSYDACRMTWQGKVVPPYPVWETGASQAMCLVSDYGDAFADTLIHVAREVGAIYFKWDAIQQYGCDSPHHWHGDSEHTQKERAESYAFQLVRVMTHIAERICEAIPEAIVDFDVTEGGRSVGAGFLAAGKYFLVNNGPYFQSFDVPIDDTQQNSNLFFFPGEARSRICRTAMTFDKWFPSTLFLAHYLLDEPRSSQISNLASLMLGQNGIWGELTRLSATDVALAHEMLARYKLIRDALTESDPVYQGSVGSSPEVYEKIHSQSGRGMVIIFSPVRGEYYYTTRHRVAPDVWQTPGVEVRISNQGKARLHINFEQPGANLVFFGN